LSYITKTLPGFEGVAAGNTATLRVPLGPTYHQIVIPYTGVTLAQLQNITVAINGIEFIAFRSGTELDLYNQYNGMVAAGGLLILDFERTNLRTKPLRELTAIGTAGGVEGGLVPSTITVSIDIDAGAVAPALTQPIARMSQPRPLGPVKKIRRFSLDANIVGENEFPNIPRGDLIQKIYFDETAVTAIDRLRVELNQFEIFNRTRAQNVRFQQVLSEDVIVPQANLFVLDFMEARFGDTMLNAQGSQDFRLKPTVAAAGAIPTTVEYLGPVEG
jgi:hypothetical protein